MTQVNRDITILEKIISYCDEIDEANLQSGNSLEALKSNSVYRNATSMCILQIGELTTHLTSEFKQRFTGVPWKAIRGMRNIAAHHYGKFDVDILWETISTRVPELKEYCTECLKTLHS
jgi:uncharacterized protein with HEPN domain